VQSARSVRWMRRAAGLIAVGAIAACNSPVQPERLAPASGPPAFEVEINQPAKLTSVAIRPEAGAQEVRVACKTCHSLREGETLPTAASDLVDFHQGLVFAHGPLACASCHVAGHHDQLKLADGTTLPMTEVMTVCGQCHGSQMRDYRRGAHGGMRGYWDLSRGPRQRNNCVDCHDPHAPAFVGGHPVSPPRDRFLEAPAPVRPQGGS
jgi:hypothetical protein